MTDDDFDRWIARRLDRPVTRGLRKMMKALSEAGFGWFEATANRLEFARSIDWDHWEEVEIWIRVTSGGLFGFNGAHHAIRAIDARTRRTDDVLAWARVPLEEVAI